MDQDRKMDSPLVGIAATNKACQDCVFAYGDTPFDDTPLKAYCAVFSRDFTAKPNDVAFYGAPCKAYIKK